MGSEGPRRSCHCGAHIRRALHREGLPQRESPRSTKQNVSSTCPGIVSHRPERHVERDAPPPGHTHVPRGQTSCLPTRLTLSKRGRSLSGSCRAMGPATCPSARRRVLRRTVMACILMSLLASCSCCMTSGSRSCRVTAYMKHSSSVSETPKTILAEALCLQQAQPRAEVCLQQRAEAPRDRRLLPWVAEAATRVSLAPCGGSSSQPQQDDCSG